LLVDNLKYYCVAGSNPARRVKQVINMEEDDEDYEEDEDESEIDFPIGMAC